MATSISGKFGRNYSLSVQTTGGNTITIQPPFTIEFDIMRQVLSSANSATIRLYNLSATNRSAIRKDLTNYGELRLINLQAGYGNTLATIFAGNVTQAWSNRENDNFITQIEAFDGGFAYTNCVVDPNLTFAKGQTQKQVIQSLAQSLGTSPQGAKTGVKLGAVGNSFNTTLPRGNSYTGSTTDNLAELSNGGFFIDNSVANILGTNEVLSGPIPLIDSESGLLGTPMREQNYVDFDMIFEPSFLIGQQIQLKSTTETITSTTGQPPTQNFNGFYKVVKIHHRGTISPSVCGDAITSVRLLPLGLTAQVGIPAA